MSVLADWLVRQAPAWLDGSRPLAPAPRRALLAITRCGGARTAAWTAQQTERLLPVPYFLVTCTVPEALRRVFAARPEVVHDLFFTQAARALQTVAARSRHLGAELGMVGVFHSWGRQMQHHPHLHFIIPGGGLTADHAAWRAARRPDWLLPGAAVSAALRGGMEAALRAAAPDLHAQVPDSCWREGWWVHWQPAGTGEQLVKYLARYVSRTAISDERIVAATDNAVTFRYTDSATQERKECSLEAVEFMRRYLQHVPPPSQHRVRYFGWMPPAAKKRRMIVETLLAVVIVVRPTVDTPQPWHLRMPGGTVSSRQFLGRARHRLPASAEPLLTVQARGWLAVRLTHL